MPHAFLFDLDGTLVDSLADLATAVNLLRQEEGLDPLSLSTVRLAIGDGARELIRRTLELDRCNDQRLQRFLALYEEHLLDQTRLYPGLERFLSRDALQPMAIVSNKPEALCRQIVAGLGLTAFFPVIIGGDSAPEKKPSPLPVQTALQALEVLAEDAILFGDHHTDLRAGAAAGVATCFCRWGFGHDDGLPSRWSCDTTEDLFRLFPGKAS
ncbi:MAG: HAD family hydrolase [Desulfuromonas sp.]|nr:MAG: HAD family hydrolase [Desulfuromonas sp.]